MENEPTYKWITATLIPIAVGIGGLFYSIGHRAATVEWQHRYANYGIAEYVLDSKTGEIVFRPKVGE